MNKILTSITLLAMSGVGACESSGTIEQRNLNQLVLQSSDLTGRSGKGWKGELTYLDYSSEERVSLDLTADVFVKINCINLQLKYPDEPQANSSEEICISEDGRSFGGAPIIALQRLGPDFVALQTRADGEDDGKPALIRKNYILSTSAITYGKEVSFDGGESWTERNEIDVER